MQNNSLVLGLSTEEKALINLDDDEVESLLESAKNGNEGAKDKLYRWSYLTAYNYYSIKVQTENSLSAEDSEELTADFFLEFERTLAKLKSAVGFTRHVLKRNLNRYLRRKKKRMLHEGITSDGQLERSAAGQLIEESTEVWKDWSDEDFFQYQAVLKALKEADDITQEIIQNRVKDPPLQYREIAALLKKPETAIRMRVTRFYALVRKKHQKLGY